MKKFLSFVFVIFLFSIGYAQLAVPTLYSPSNNSTNMAVTQRLCVTKVSGANYYEIELDTTSNFNSPLKQTLNASSYNSSYSYYYTIVNNLLYGTKYYWRARYTNSTDTSGWSAVWNFTTRAVPQLYTPSDNSTNMDVSQRLGVTKLSGTNYYEIELDTTSNFNSPMKQTLDANTYYSSYDYYYTTVGNLLYDTKYYWRARCAHAADTSGWSAVRNFTTRAVPQLYTPSDNSTNMDVSQRLGVTKLSGTNYYEIELDTTSNFNSPMKQTLDANTYYSSYDYYYTTVGNLLYGTKYYWRARCAHAADTSGWSAVRNFTTRAVPQLYTPSDNSTNMDVSQRLGVTKLSGTNYYEIELDTTSNFNSPMKQTLDANTYYSSYDYYYTIVSNLLYGTKYYWRARCAHAADTSGWSAVRNFTTRAVPLLYTPSDNSTNTDVSLRLGVTKLSGTTYYEIELDTTSNFNSPMKQTLNADTYYSSYDYYYTTVSNLLYGTKYYWRARCMHAADTSGWSAVRNFTTRAVPLLYTPSNNSTNMAVTQRLGVTKVSGTTYYEIELDTTSNFNSPMKQTLNADTYYSSYDYYYTTVSNLLYGTKYYWRARCAHAADTSGWSVVWNFTTGARPLLYSPNNNTTNMAVTQRLCVQQFTGSNYYEIELDTTSNFDSPMKQTLNADTYYSSYSYYYTTVSNLLYGTKYYWRARCAHAADTTDWSAVWDFTTGARPLLYSPNNNTTNISITQRLCVQQFTGSNYYEIELDTTSNFDSPMKQTLNADTYYSSYSYYYTTVSNLLYGTKYYWRARCAHAADTSGWSAVWNFTTQFTLTAAPTLISPVNGATNIDAQNVTLTWNEIANATSYQYQVSTTSDFSNLVASGTTANPYVFVALPGNITCYWRVRGSDGLGFSPWSVIWHFSTIINCDDPVYTDQYATDCYSYSWHGETYTETGVYYDTLSTFLGCDSIVALHLTISQSITSTISINVCESDLPYHYVNGDIDTTFEVGTPQLSTFNFQFLTSHGCDSIVTLDLTISTPTEGDLTATACGSFNWLGQLLTESGDYTDVLTNAAGCDSTVTLHLTINTPTEGDTSAVACGSFNWHGQNLTESGDYTDVLTNAMGCDSIVTLHLTVYPVVTEPVEVTVCERDLPYHYVNGNIDTTFEVGTPQLSTFNFQFSTQYGCDSIVALHLTIYSTVTELVEVTICENDLPYHYVNGDIDTTFEVGTPQLSTFNFQFLTSYGCDSIVTLDLTINTPTEGDLTATACGSFNWLGQLLTESGDYTDVLTNAAGCDSTVTLHLTINTPTEGDTSAVACGSFNWHGQNLTESGDYTDVLTNAMGCDSIVTLHLTVYPTVTELVEVTICENDLPYHYVNGDIDTTFEVGTPQLSTFNFQLSTQYGCDSIVSLTLIVNASDTDSTRIVDLDLGGRIRLYPNPTLGKVWIDVQNGVEIQQISIFDLAGREVKVPSLSVQSHSEIDLTDCVRGIYMVRIVTNEGILVRKITRM